MELGIKKISYLNKRNTLNMIGKLALQENTFHNCIYRKAIEVNTKTIEYWKNLLFEMNITEFDHIKEHCDNDYTK